MSQDKLRVSNVLDAIQKRTYTDEHLNIMENAKYGTLKYFSEKLWMCLAILETGILHSERSQDLLLYRDNAYNPLFVKRTFELVQRHKVPPHYPSGAQKLRESGHTLREAAVRGAVKTLTLALTIKSTTPDMLSRLAQITTSMREIDDPLLTNTFDTLLHFGADLSARNNAVLNNIDTSLGGQSLLFRDDVKDSEVLSLIDKSYFPFFEMLTKYKIAYVTPLILKYHLLVTDKTPFDYLLDCKEEERAATLILMRA